MDFIYLGLLIFLTVVLYGAYLLVKIKHRRTTLQEFLELEEDAKEENYKRFRAPKIKLGILHRLVIKGRQAGFTKVGEIELILVILGSSTLCFLVITALFSTAYVGTVGIVIGAYLPINYLNGRIRKRGDILSKQLLSTLIMWSNSIRSGSTLSQAISASIDRVKPEIREELQLIKHDINLGDTAPEALVKALERIPVLEFKMVVMTAKIHSQLGGNLAERLDNIASTIEDRLLTRDNLKAYTTQARLGAAVAGLMPFGVLAFLRIASPDYLKPMVESDIGLILLMLSVVLVFLGWSTIRRMGETNTV